MTIYLFYFSINASLFGNIQTVETVRQRHIAGDTDDGVITRKCTLSVRRLVESAVSLNVNWLLYY